MKYAILAAVSAWLGFLAGQTQHAVKSAARQARLQIELADARRMAAQCHRMIADHWEHIHLAVPGSPEVVAQSRQLADELERPVR